MEKKEKKSHLEGLLNTLIQGGWKPFGYEDVYIETSEGEDFDKEGYVILRDKKGGTYEVVQDFRPYRFICMRESGLWQFVCENKLLAKGILDLPDILWKRDSLACMRTDLRKSCYPHNYEYRLIETALTDEDKLEEFLLENIKL